MTPEERKEALKEKARIFRRQAYERGKELSKAQKLERANSPEAEARKLRLKERRRQDYLKAKELRAERALARKNAEKEHAATEAKEQEALRDQELLKSLLKGSDVPAPWPKLRLVKNDKA